MKSSKGFTLVISIVTTLVVFILAESLFASLAGHIDLIAGQCDNIRAYNMAEAGLARGIIQLRAGGAAATNNINDAPLGSGTYSVQFTPLAVALGQLPSFMITSTGVCGNANRTLRLEVFEKSFAQWVSFTNSETDILGERLYFITGDLIDGPVHTNGQFNIWGSPEFLGHVSSVSSTIFGSQDGIFSGGKTLGAPSIPIPAAEAVLAPVFAAATTAGGLYLEGDTIIEFINDGNMWVTNAEVLEGARTLTSLPANGAIYVTGGSLNLSGTLNGNVTVGAGKNDDGLGGDITIVGDLKYAGPRDEAGMPTSADNMLGLVAAENVLIGKMAEHDLEIDAYIVTPNKSFMFPEYKTVKKGILKVYGGIAQMNAGVTGTFSKDMGVLTGYTQQAFTYDKRMERSSPLYYPSLTDSTGRIVYMKRLWRGK